MKKIIVMMMLAAMFLFGCGSSEEAEVQETVEETEVIESETEEVEVQEETTEDKSSEAQQIIDRAEAEAAELEKKLAEDESLTQDDMNELSNEIYVIWDNALTDIWGLITVTQNEETIKSLEAEQIEWSENKEAEAKEAGAEYAGGSMEALLVNQKAAELTCERVYELAEEYLGL